MDKRLVRQIKGNLALLVTLAVLVLASLIATFLCLRENPVKYNADDLSTYVGRCDGTAHEAVDGFRSTSHYVVLHMEDGKKFYVGEKWHLYGWETMLDPESDQFEGKQLKLTYDNRDTLDDFGHRLVAVESADGATVYLSTSQTEAENLKALWCWIGIVLLILFSFLLMLYLSTWEYFTELKEDRAREKRKKREKEKAAARRERYLRSPESFNRVKNKKK